MRAPPGLGQATKYPVTVGVGLLAAVVTIAYWGGRDITPLLMSHRTFWTGLVTSVLPHADIFHLGFNLYWLWVFGTFIEERIGRLAMVGLILFLAVGTSAAEYAVFEGGIGLSGVGYGLFGMLFVLERRDPRFAGGMDSGTVKLFIAWFFLCIALTVTHVWRIGNVAHGSGAVLGALVGLAIASPRVASRALWSRPALGLAFAACLAGATVFRARVNLSGAGGRESARRAYAAFQAGKYDEAVADYKRATEQSPRKAMYWYDLGTALLRVQRQKDAAAAFRKARDLAPGNEKYSSAADEYDPQRGAMSQ